MPEIIVDLDCNEKECGSCQALDKQRNHCDLFLDFIEDDERCAECLEGEENLEILCGEIEE